MVDLSSLWAGPLCGQLLAAAGADVIKVESTARPDGARRGPASFFDLLNGEKRSVALDVSVPAGRHVLRRLIETADVVIESARPRALEQMGIAAYDLLGQSGGPRAWVSITSHGRDPGSAQRVGFGDCAAVAGGLVAGDGLGPCFLADAVADPLAGLVAAAAVLEALSAGGRWLLDAAMAPMAASAAGPLLDVPADLVQPPRAREIVCRAPMLGADTASVLEGVVSTLVLRDAEVEGVRVDVRVEDTVVSAVGPPGSLPGGDTEIVCGGGALVPGLHDHHVHLLAMAAVAGSVDVSRASIE